GPSKPYIPEGIGSVTCQVLARCWRRSCGSVMSRLSEAASFSRWTLPPFRERHRDSLCYRGCAREGDVRHYCHRQSAFGDRKKGRHFFNPKVAIVAGGLDLVTRQCHGLEVPA